MALLVIGFFSDAARAVHEMRRVTKPGGIVAACWWDVGRDNEFHQRIWDAITSLDPTVKRPTGGAMAYGSPDALSSLWNAAGLTNVEVSGLNFLMSPSRSTLLALPVSARPRRAGGLRRGTAGRPPRSAEATVSPGRVGKSVRGSVYNQSESLGGARDSALTRLFLW